LPAASVRLLVAVLLVLIPARGARLRLVARQLEGRRGQLASGSRVLLRLLVVPAAVASPVESPLGRGSRWGPVAASLDR
jgi:hypothetical protein